MFFATAAFVAMQALVKLSREAGWDASEVMFYRTAPGLPLLWWMLRRRGRGLATDQPKSVLARALAPNPAILVADEPTGNLDEATGKQIIDLLFAGHVERGTTLVLVTHDPALAQRCDRIVHMRSGRIETPAKAAAHGA